MTGHEGLIADLIQSDAEAMPRRACILAYTFAIACKDAAT